MRNLLLDDECVLWVIDWGFPPWFEYLGMRHASQKSKDPKSWQVCIKHMAEPAFEVEKWMKKIGYGHPTNDRPFKVALSCIKNPTILLRALGHDVVE